MHFRCVFILLLVCVLVGLDWAKPMMILMLHVTYSCIFHAYVPSFILIMKSIYVGAFLHVSLSLSLYLSVSLSFVSCSMAPKWKSTSSRNPFHSGASSSDSTPSHVRFRDDKARKEFLENFFRWGIHSERQVILLNFSDTDLPIVIYSRGWESLCGISITCPSIII